MESKARTTEVKLLGKGTAPPQELKLLVARGKTYDAAAERANKALERLNKTMGQPKPGSERLIVGHGI